MSEHEKSIVEQIVSAFRKEGKSECECCILRAELELCLMYARECDEC